MQIQVINEDIILRPESIVTCKGLCQLIDLTECL